MKNQFKLSFEIVGAKETGVTTTVTLIGDVISPDGLLVLDSCDESSKLEMKIVAKRPTYVMEGEYHTVTLYEGSINHYDALYRSLNSYEDFSTYWIKDTILEVLKANHGLVSSELAGITYIPETLPVRHIRLESTAPNGMSVISLEEFDEKTGYTRQIILVSHDSTETENGLAIPIGECVIYRVYYDPCGYSWLLGTPDPVIKCNNVIVLNDHFTEVVEKSHSEDALDLIFSTIIPNYTLNPSKDSPIAPYVDSYSWVAEEEVSE